MLAAVGVFVRAIYSMEIFLLRTYPQLARVLGIYKDLIFSGNLPLCHVHLELTDQLKGYEDEAR